jgi:hypothetical protein
MPAGGVSTGKVSCLGLDPSAPMTQTAQLPSPRWLAYAIQVPKLDVHAV